VTIQLYHHPRTRAANVIWMLEEVGADYEIRHVDAQAGEQKSAEILALNPMGKLPILVDGDAVVTEVAAIALYLADRYAAGRLAPALDDPRRGTYLRWILFSPSVIEPNAIANSSGWPYTAGAAGWGTKEAMLASIEHAIGDGPFLLGEQFSMADVVFGGTVGWMMLFGMLEKRPRFEAYVARLNERPARKYSLAKNAEIMKELGLG